MKYPVGTRVKYSMSGAMLEEDYAPLGGGEVYVPDEALWGWGRVVKVDPDPSARYPYTVELDHLEPEDARHPRDKRSRWYVYAEEELHRAEDQV